jgi:hypothetical protein
MSDVAPTKPTLEAILKEMRQGFASIGARLTAIETRLSSVERRLNVIESQLFNMDIRLGRLDGAASGAHSEVMNLRADFKEFRAQFNASA